MILGIIYSWNGLAKARQAPLIKGEFMKIDCVLKDGDMCLAVNEFAEFISG